MDSSDTTHFLTKNIKIPDCEAAFQYRDDPFLLSLSGDHHYATSEQEFKHRGALSLTIFFFHYALITSCSESNKN